jgi:hypothetical protein
MFILNRFFEKNMPRQNRASCERSLREMVCDFGYSERVAAELWKWYDTSKKGVASF